jgi:predicted transcriptional regulator
VQYTVDERQLVLQQTGKDYGLSRRAHEMNTLLITLADNEGLQDRLLITIEDALQYRQP